MTLYEIKHILEETGIPVAYRMFPENEAPPLPFICYFEDNSSNFGADGIVYEKIRSIFVEFYSHNKDVENEEIIEQVFEENRIYWEKQEAFLDDEKCYEIIYSLEV